MRLCTCDYVPTFCELGLGKPDPDALVFCNYDQTPISPNYFGIWWKRTLKRAGLPAVTFHSLRHFHASSLIAAGMDVVKVSRRLGHSSPVITLAKYAHLFNATDNDATLAAAIERLVKGSA